MGEQRMSNCDHELNTLPPDPAVKAAEWIASWSVSHYTAIIRDAYAPLVAERDRLRSELAEIESAVSPINDWFHGDCDPLPSLVARVTDTVETLQGDRRDNLKLKAELASAREQIGVFNALLSKPEPKCAPAPVPIGEPVPPGTCDGTCGLSQPAWGNHSDNSWTCSKCGGTPSAKDARDPAIEAGKFVCVECSGDDAEGTDRLARVARAVRDAVLASVKPCGHTSEPLTDAERLLLADAHHGGQGCCADAVDHVVARRIRPKCNHGVDLARLKAANESADDFLLSDGVSSVILPTMTIDGKVLYMIGAMDRAVRAVLCRQCRHPVINHDPEDGSCDHVNDDPVRGVCRCGRESPCSHRTLADDLTPEEVERMAKLGQSMQESNGGEVYWPQIVRALAAEFRAGAKRGKMTLGQQGSIGGLCRAWAQAQIESEEGGEERFIDLRDYVNSLLTGEKGGQT
jgi:hypothetical protein